MSGFFSVTKFRKRRDSSFSVPKCGLCKLHKGCISPRIPCTGEGRKKILIIGEAPSEKEDKKGIPLIGKASQELRHYLKRMKVDLDRDCWRTNAVTCCPKEALTDDQILACRPYALKTIKTLNPNVVILLGGVPVKSLIGSFYKESPGSIGLWAGYLIPNRKPNVWVAPTYHPSLLLRNSKNEALSVLFEKHLKRAVKRAGSKPWDTVEDYRQQVEILTSPQEAARRLIKMSKWEGDFAFDYETNCVKPEYPKARIYCASVCWEGKETFSFPWSNKTKEAMGDLLFSKNGKIAANLKFEDRWSRFVYNRSIVGWKWDTMLAAHMLDNQKGAAGLKFQAYVRLGVEDYNSHLDSFLETKDKRTPYNRIEDIEPEELMLYNGLDSLLTYRVAQVQTKLLGKGVWNGRVQCGSS